MRIFTGQHQWEQSSLITCLNEGRIPPKVASIGYDNYQCPTLAEC